MTKCLFNRERIILNCIFVYEIWNPNTSGRNPHSIEQFRSYMNISRCSFDEKGLKGSKWTSVYSLELDQAMIANVYVYYITLSHKS